MNQFGKNPFTQVGVAKAVKPLKLFDEKEKIQGIRETMSKLKVKPTLENGLKKEMSVNEKVNVLKDMDRLK